MITGDLVMSTVKDRLESEYDLDKTVSELKGAIQVQQSQNSQMFSIVATDTKVFASSGQRVLLVDADMRKPTFHKTFGLSNDTGLSLVLSANQSVLENARIVGIENLSILPSGPKPPNPSELLGSVRMNQVIEEARHLYDVVIFDMPPVVAVTDAQIMASKADGTLLVVRENVTRKDALTNAKNLLEMVQARVLGVVYNGTQNMKDQGYYYYYGN